MGSQTIIHGILIGALEWIQHLDTNPLTMNTAHYGA
jgi:hypothetical protein